MSDEHRSAEDKQKVTIDDWLRAKAVALTRPVAEVLARLNVHPNTITLFGLTANIIAGFVVAYGSLRVGGLIMLAGSSTDALDGTLARLTSRQSRFGAFLDSTLDRLSEGAVLTGLIAWYVTQASLLGALLCVTVLLGSVMVSYTRARAEGLGFDCKVGWFTRPIRVFILGLGLVTTWLVPILTVLSVLTWFTVGQRVRHVYLASQDEVRAT
ncbi:MAG: CDP-alcohol phosphatidyltransferase family protein [Anaerolineae bacterium]